MAVAMMESATMSDRDGTVSVGVIGLGLIGGALARRLVETGDAPVVFDLRADAVHAAVGAGAIAARSCAELARRCDIVLVCVQSDEQCVAAVHGDGGVLDGARPGACIAVLSTVLPATIAVLAARAAERGVHLVDTPVAGRGMFSVGEGTMSVLVGDEGELVARLEPTLLRFASRVVRAGQLGSGAALKLAHNVIVYAGFAAMIEAVELARAAGVRDGLVEDVARTSGALSALSAFHLPVYKHLRDEPHGVDEDQILRVAAALVDKDLADAVALAEAHGLELPIARLLCHSGSAIFQVDR
jgi:3-hydroxyisobutyrate dehydrogenase-like beta-hydroxyacid dehydrogenase